MRLADLISAYTPRRRAHVQTPTLSADAQRALVQATKGWTPASDWVPLQASPSGRTPTVYGAWKKGEDRLVLAWDDKDPDAPWVFRQTRWARVPPKPATKKNKTEKPEPKPTTTHEVRAGRVEDAIALLRVRMRDGMAASEFDWTPRTRRTRIKEPTATRVRLLDDALLPAILDGMRAADNSTLIVQVAGEPTERTYRRASGDWTEQRVARRTA